MFKINFLDHVAIAARDMEVSAKWYEDTLGLERVQHEEWGPFPIMMMCGESGVAIFPAKTDSPDPIPEKDTIMIKHFAFNVSNDDFKKAQDSFNERGIPFTFQEHHIYHSIYLNDPDGHVVELTTKVK